MVLFLKLIGDSGKKYGADHRRNSNAAMGDDSLQYLKNQHRVLVSVSRYILLSDKGISVFREGNSVFSMIKKL